MTSDELLPPIVIEALHRGETIEAIKLLRVATGLGLKEAKDVIDGYADDKLATSRAILPTGQLSASVVEALQQGNKIEAIKRLREQTGLGLKEAKDAVDASGYTVGAQRRQTTIERPQSNNAVWWFAGLLLFGYSIYYLLKNT
jgi:ribosomal protein L7/L12